MAAQSKLARRALALVPLLLALLAIRRRLARTRGPSLLPRTPSLPPTTPQLEEDLRYLYRPQEGVKRELLVPDAKGRIHNVVLRPIPRSTFEAHRPYFTRVQQSLALDDGGRSEASKKKVGVNRDFYR
jgi:hypothetical protein